MYKLFIFYNIFSYLPIKKFSFSRSFKDWEVDCVERFLVAWAESL